MKCGKIESLIYLYYELDQQERHLVDMHMNECSSCKALFVKTSGQHSLIRKVGEMPLTARSPEQIKRNIMKAVESSNRNWFDEFVTIVTTHWIRAPLAVASMLLTGFFFVELSSDHSQMNIRSKYTASTTYLNTSKFLEVQVKRRESVAQVSIYDCFKQKDCDFLKNLKTNKNL